MCLVFEVPWSPVWQTGKTSGAGAAATATLGRHGFGFRLACTLCNPPPRVHADMHTNACALRCAGAAATITGAATSAASVGIVTTSSGAAGAAYYSSKMAKRAADISEFGFVRLAEWQEYQAAARDADGASAADPEACEGSPVREPAGGGAPAAAGRGSASQRMKKNLSSGWGWGKSALRSTRSKLQREPSAGVGAEAGPDVSAGAAVPHACFAQPSQYTRDT